MDKFTVKKGLSADLKPDTLLQGELGFNIDTHELMCGTNNGPVKVSEIVKGPDEGFYIKIDDNRFLPIGLYTYASKG